MGAELAKPIALTLCMVSIYAVFHAAFLIPAIGVEQRLCDALELLAVTAGISVASGFLFRDSARNSPPNGNGERTPKTIPLGATLPIQLFLWAAAILLLLFVASWYLETYCIFYRDIRRL